MNHPELGRALAADRILDLQRTAESARRVELARGPAPAAPGDCVVVREAAPVDASALARLAVLDESTVPEGRLLIALVNGRPLAAVGRDGSAIGDPFAPTEALVAELRRRVGELEDRPGGGALRHLARAWSWATARA
jgi:hypothetical protein